MLRPILAPGWLLVSCALLASPPARAADDCSDFRLDAFGGSLSNVPVLDQDGTDTCYAYTAAQMADAFRHNRAREQYRDRKITQAEGEEELRHLTSPLAASAAYAVANGQDTVNMGRLKDALNGIFADGSCAHQRFGQEFGAYRLDGFLSGVRQYFDGLRAAGPGRPAPRPPSPLDCCLESPSKPDAPLNRRTLEGFLRGNDFMGFLKQTVRTACAAYTRAIPAPPKTAFYASSSDADPAARARKLKELFRRSSRPGHMPIGIDFCADVLTDPRATGVNSRGHFENCRRLHSAMIIGRRRGPGGRCRFLVRQSFGHSCNAYPPGSCDERGQLLVDEEDLLRNTAGVVTIE